MTMMMMMLTMMLMIMLTNDDDIDVKDEIAVGMNFLKLLFKKERNPLTLNTLISLDSAAVGLLCFTKWKLSIGNIKAFQQQNEIYIKDVKNGFNTNVAELANTTDA